jgi:hypothetical protein
MNRAENRRAERMLSDGTRNPSFLSARTHIRDRLRGYDRALKLSLWMRGMMGARTPRHKARLFDLYSFGVGEQRANSSGMLGVLGMLDLKPDMWRSPPPRTLRFKHATSDIPNAASCLAPRRGRH